MARGTDKDKLKYLFIKGKDKIFVWRLSAECSSKVLMEDERGTLEVLP